MCVYVCVYIYINYNIEGLKVKTNIYSSPIKIQIVFNNKKTKKKEATITIRKLYANVKTIKKTDQVILYCKEI